MQKVLLASNVPLGNLLATQNAERDYLSRLFGSIFGQPGGLPQLAQPWYGVVAVLSTLLYSQLAFFIFLWILFTSNIVGLVIGVVVISLALAFTIPLKPRPVGLLVLASLNLIMAGGITLVVAVQEGIPAVLVSLVIPVLLFWLALRYALKNITLKPGQEERVG